MQIPPVLPSQVVGMKTTVDIVYVIDSTGSMQKLLDAVKAHALTMYDRIQDVLRQKRRAVQRMRIKVIMYRDIYVDAEPFVSSDFFTLPGEASALEYFVENIRAQGGGDEPESGLEALHYAIKSDWKGMDANFRKTRHIIVVMTDASAHRLDDPQRYVDPSNFYPMGIPSDLASLQGEWEATQDKLDNKGRRLILFAPNAYPWSEVAGWALTQHSPIGEGGTLDEDSYISILNYIANSI